MDDGFQNPSLHQDLAFVVVDGACGFGNGRLLPAGPLREPIATGYRRAGAVVIVGEDRRSVARSVPHGLPALRASFRPVNAEDLVGRAAVAFAGIGRPAKFFETLGDAGVEVVERHAFPDHHRYRDKQLSHLLARAAARRAVALTTAKDLVRIPPALRPCFRALDIELSIEPEDLLVRLLACACRSIPITMS